MKIAVCVKQVPEGGGQRKIDPQTKRLDRSGEAGLNPFDANAIEEALRIRGSGGGGRGRARLDGPGARRRDPAQGARDGRRPRRPRRRRRARGSDLVGTSAVLAKALARESADLVLFGQQASDSDGAVLAAAVAERLQLPLVTQVSELTVAAGTAKAKRQTEFGYDRMEAPLPAVIAVSDAINEPRYPSLKGIMGAKSKPQETLALADLELAAGAAGESRRADLRGRPRGAARPRRHAEDRGRRLGRREDRRFLAERKLL